MGNTQLLINLEDHLTEAEIALKKAQLMANDLRNDFFAIPIKYKEDAKMAIVWEFDHAETRNDIVVDSLDELENALAEIAQKIKTAFKEEEKQHG